MDGWSWVSYCQIGKSHINKKGRLEWKLWYGLKSGTSLWTHMKLNIYTNGYINNYM